MRIVKELQYSNCENEMEVFQYIKDNYLSKNRFPSLVVGTGLSIEYGIAGMSKLAEKLAEHFANDKTHEETWKKIEKNISKKGLEAGLEMLRDSEDKKIIDVIVNCTAKLLLEEMKNKIDEIKTKKTGFKILLDYLIKTCSTNNKIINIMTPNYDLIIEILCDDLGIEVIDGFEGNFFCRFNQSLIKIPSNKFKLNGNYKYVRLFKPHGSINWLKEGEKIIKTNNLHIIEKNIKESAIIVPGGDKYRQGMLITELREIREAFNNQISNMREEPLLIYGYGFNDDHFNNVILEKDTIPLLVVTKNITERIEEKLIKKDNVIAFYEKDGKNVMMYSKTKYEINEAMWHMDVFIKNMIS